MKKITALALAILMALTFASCTEDEFVDKGAVTEDTPVTKPRPSVTYPVFVGDPIRIEKTEFKGTYVQSVGNSFGIVLDAYGSRLGLDCDTEYKAVIHYSNKLVLDYADTFRDYYYDLKSNVFSIVGEVPYYMFNMYESYQTMDGEVIEYTGSPFYIYDYETGLEELDLFKNVKDIFSAEKKSNDSTKYSYTYSYYSGPMSDGMAFVLARREEHTESALGAVGTDITWDACLVDKDAKTYPLPEGFSDISGGGGSGWITTYRVGLYREGLMPLYEAVYDGLECKYQFRGYADKKGTLTVPLDAYTDGSPFSGKYARVTDKDGNVGFIDNEGNTVIPCIYEDAEDFDYNKVAVKKDGKWGVISSKNEEILPFEYEDVNFSEGFASVKQGGVWGVIDIDGNKQVAFEYDFISSFVDSTAFGIKDGEIYVIRRIEYE